jgi:hypothetical protein
MVKNVQTYRKVIEELVEKAVNKSLKIKYLNNSVQAIKSKEEQHESNTTNYNQDKR